MFTASRNQKFVPAMFNEFFNDWNIAPVSKNVPQMNFSESEKDYLLELAVPGLSKDDLSITLAEENILVIATEKRDVKSDDVKRRYMFRDFTISQFKQNIALPEDIRKDEISAQVVNGVLYVSIPKILPEDKMNLIRKIDIA